MTIIITMAGIGKRFKDAGYNSPKYMIEVKGKSLFEWSMESLTDYFKYCKKIIFVVRKEDNASSFINKKIAAFGDMDVVVVELDHKTDGQATTCYLALDYCDQDDEFVVYNIDTYVEADAIRYESIKGDGHIPCFQAEGEHWSFARLDKSGNVVEVREKKRISDNCTLGAYYFKSIELYKQIYEEYYSKGNNEESGEKYIAPLYNYMIERGMQVTISKIDADKVHVLGTPEELELFRNIPVK